MTWTYDITTSIGQVRLITGSNITTDQVFTDEEVQFFLTTHGTVNLASAALLDAWAASYLANVDSEKIGDYSYAQTVAKKMRDHAAQLRANDAMTPAMNYAEMDLTGEDD